MSSRSQRLICLDLGHLKLLPWHRCRLNMLLQHPNSCFQKAPERGFFFLFVFFLILAWRSEIVSKAATLVLYALPQSYWLLLGGFFSFFFLPVSQPDWQINASVYVETGSQWELCEVFFGHVTDWRRCTNAPCAVLAARWATVGWENGRRNLQSCSLGLVCMNKVHYFGSAMFSIANILQFSLLSLNTASLAMREWP